jgi:sugar transferase (PEP-CTERM/EpsH1 system associated)
VTSTGSVPLVVHIIYELGTGGLENGLVNLINRSDPRRYRHAIVCLTGARDFAGRIERDDVSVVELHKRPGHDLRAYWRLYRALRVLKPDVVHTRNLAALEMQLLTLLLPGVKRVHGEHGRDVGDLDGSNPRYHWLRRLLQPFLHRFICVSQDLADWLRDTVGIPTHRVTQIYNGVDCARFEAEAAAVDAAFPPGFRDGQALVIGTVGRAATVKDQQTLVSAVARLSASDASWRDRLRLVIVGDGELLPALKRQVEEQGLADISWLPGDREDVPAILGGMTLFVLPSLAEGISNTILEAMASGLPVVATRTGGNAELVDDGVTGRLVPVGNAAALASTLAEMLDHPQRLATMGEAGRAKVAARFDWDSTVAAYLDVYDSALGRSALPAAA